MPKKGHRVALVTGAASGIGEGIATHLAVRGHRVVVLDRNGEGAARVARAISDRGGAAFDVEADVANETQVATALDAVRETFGHPEIVVNNAGYAHMGPLERIQTDEWDALIATHLRGTFLCTRETLPAMRRSRWGRIVNISSISALGEPDRAAYVAAKAGIEGLTRATAHEGAPYGITANAIGPGVVVTGMTAQGASLRGRTLDEHTELLRQSVAVGRVGTPYDVARTVDFFADEAAGYVTGQVLYVSGTPQG